MKDMTSWYSLVADGGLVAGTGYEGETRRAIDEFALLNGVTVSSHSSTLTWMFAKN
jgi:hypothetical protein